MKFRVQPARICLMVIKYSLFLPLGGQQTPKRATSSLFRARNYIKTHPPQPPLLHPGESCPCPVRSFRSHEQRPYIRENLPAPSNIRGPAACPSAGDSLPCAYVHTLKNLEHKSDLMKPAFAEVRRPCRARSKTVKTKRSASALRDSLYFFDNIRRQTSSMSTNLLPTRSHEVR